jgi:hypothetical protein
MWRPLHAGPIRDRIIEHRLEQQARDNEDREHAEPVSLPSSLSGYPLILSATWYCRVDLIVIS